MNEIYNIIPKDLALIVEDYAVNRTNYDNVISALEWKTRDIIEEHAEDWCLDCGDIGCDFVPMRIMKTRFPECYHMHINCVNKLLKKKKFIQYLLSK